MSIRMSLKRLTDSSRERMLADPKEITLCFDLPDTKPFSFLDLLKKHFNKKQAEDGNPQEHDPCFEDDECDLDKSWDVLCFLFCADTFGIVPDESHFPANFLFPSKGTVELSDLYGYGPPWTYSSSEVKQITDFLDTQTKEGLRDKFLLADLKKADPYPSIWHEYEDAESMEWKEEQDWFLAFLPELKRFVRETADLDLALLIYLA